MKAILQLAIALGLSGLCAGGAAANGYQGYIGSLDPALQAHIQEALRNKGFNPGPIDGLYGSRTRAALFGFCATASIDCSDEHLTVDLGRALLGIEIDPGHSAEELREEEQLEVLRQLGLTPTRDYWGDSYVFPE